MYVNTATVLTAGVGAAMLGGDRLHTGASNNLHDSPLSVPPYP